MQIAEPAARRLTAWIRPGDKGARRQVQGGAVAHPGFCFSVFFSAQYPCTEYDTETPPHSSYTECNTTAGFGVPNIDTRQIYPSTLD